MSWHVYMIEASDGSLYTGITTDIERRFEQHLQGTRGARYFSGRKPVAVVYRESGHDRSSASRREAEIKRLSRRCKLQLIADLKKTEEVEGVNVDVIHNSEQQQFVIELENGDAILSYRQTADNGVDFYSTYVPLRARGKGYAEQLVNCGLTWAREAGLNISASCWYVRDHLEQ